MIVVSLRQSKPGLLRLHIGKERVDAWNSRCNDGEMNDGARLLVSTCSYTAKS